MTDPFDVVGLLGQTPQGALEIPAGDELLAPEVLLLPVPPEILDEGIAVAARLADTARSAPSERMLAQVAACVAVRRAGVVPGPVHPPVAAPRADDRPVCVPA